jgi:hypothetical protein
MRRNLLGCVMLVGLCGWGATASAADPMTEYLAAVSDLAPVALSRSPALADVWHRLATQSTDPRARARAAFDLLGFVARDADGGALASDPLTAVYRRIDAADDALRRADGYGGTFAVAPDGRIRLTAPDGVTFVDP